MEFIVETIINGGKTQKRIDAENFVAAENMVRNPALQNGETVIDVLYGDMSSSGVSIIRTIIGDSNIERRIYPARINNK